MSTEMAESAKSIQKEGAGALPSVSVIVPARNEIGNIRDLVACIEGQTVAALEALVMDGCSTDGTWELLHELARTRPWLRPVRNPDKVTPAALNIGFAQSKGTIVARMDTHARYPADYIETALRTFAEHPEAWAVGSAMATVGVGAWGRAIAAVLSRPFGLGGARHRVGGRGGPVEHVFTGVYVRQRVIEAGGFDTAQLTNQDYELDYRLRTLGGTVWLEPSLRSEWYAKESPGALVRQMARYGYGRALTLSRHPRSLRPRQLAPPVVAALLLSSAMTRAPWAVRLSGLYFAAAFGLGAMAGRQDGASPWRAGLTVPLVHLAWGGGLLVGLLRHSVARTPTQPPRPLSVASAPRGQGSPTASVPDESAG
jgi:succinoglycan biosynthesis protein ExoA